MFLVILLKDSICKWVGVVHGRIPVCGDEANLGDEKILWRVIRPAEPARGSIFQVAKQFAFSKTSMVRGGDGNSMA